MAVATDDEHARFQMTALRKHDVANALAVVESNLAFLRPTASQFEDMRTLIGIARHKMVGDQHHLRRIEQANAELAQDRLDAARAARVVDDGKVDPRGDNIPGANRVTARCAGYELFCKRRGHYTSPR